MIRFTYLAATHDNFICIYIYMIVWIDAVVVEEVISLKWKLNFTYLMDTSEFTLIILISYFQKYE